MRLHQVCVLASIFSVVSSDLSVTQDYDYDYDTIFDDRVEEACKKDVDQDEGIQLYWLAGPALTDEGADPKIKALKLQMNKDWSKQENRFVFQKLIVGFAKQQAVKMRLDTLEADDILDDWFNKFRMVVYKKQTLWVRMKQRWDLDQIKRDGVQLVAAEGLQSLIYYVDDAVIGMKLGKVAFDNRHAVSAAWTAVKVAVAKSAPKLLQRVNALACSPLVLRLGGALSVGFLGWNFFIQVRAWWTRQIDGYKATENILSNLAGVAAGVAAGTFVATTALGPVAGVLVGLVLSYGAEYLASEAIAMLFQELFMSDLDRALRESFKALDLTPGASDSEVQTRYRDLARIHHPDKGGDKDMFFKISHAYETIHVERLMPRTSSKSEL